MASFLAEDPSGRFGTRNDGSKDFDIGLIRYRLETGRWDKNSYDCCCDSRYLERQEHYTFPQDAFSKTQRPLCVVSAKLTG